MPTISPRRAVFGPAPLDLPTDRSPVGQNRRRMSVDDGDRRAVDHQRIEQPSFDEPMPIVA
jgi:hypothetical protein